MSVEESVWSMNNPKRPLAGMKLGFVGKGGAGKSTTLVLLARALRLRGYEVCVLDTDSTNLGLAAALGMEEPRHALIELFGGMVFHGGAVACPADDPELIEGAEIHLELLPDEFKAESPDGITFLSAGKLETFGIGAGCDGPLVKIARDLRVRRGKQPVVMLVDLKAGIEDTSRGVLVGMDRCIVVADPSTAGLAVAVYMKRMLRLLSGGAEPATAHLETPEKAELSRRLFRESRLREVDIVLNKVPDTETETYMREALQHYGVEPVASLPDCADLRKDWLRGNPLHPEACRPALDGLIDAMESGVFYEAEVPSA